MTIQRKKVGMLAGTGLLCFGLVACGGSSDNDDHDQPGATAGDTMVLTAAGRIMSFDRTTPGTAKTTATVTGLPSGESLLGIDIRPADDKLYGLTNTGGIYTIDPVSGVATRKSTLVANAGDAFTALSGTAFGFDFNPAADRLRVISNTGQSLRINVDTGATITDGSINGGAAGTTVTAAAYTNSFAGTGTTQLWDIDTGTDTVYLQNPPNDGTLTGAIPLGVDASAANGFDIDASNNVGLAALTVGGRTSLYRINLAPAAGASAATLVGQIGDGAEVRGLAVRQKAAPTVVGLTFNSRLVTFKHTAPGTLTSNVAISGLNTGESVVGMDMRPSDGKLYALTVAGRLATIDPSTGVATVVSTLRADPADTTDPYTTFPGAGVTYSVDFNPAADRLRVITSTGRSLRINVATGDTTTDGNINRAGSAPVVAAAAYTNSFPTPGSTALYDLERTGNVLALQNPPNDGTLVNVGPLNLTLGGRPSFDIAGGGNGLALLANPAAGIDASKLYNVNLATGAATAVTATDTSTGLIGGTGGPAIIDIAIKY